MSSNPQPQPFTAPDSPAPHEPVSRLAEAAEQVESRYADGAQRPLGSYLGAMGTYGALVLGGAALIRQRRAPLPERVSSGDLALLAVATHKLSRTLTKDAVTSPLRAPFTRFKGQAGPGELNEDVVTPGWGHGVGELLTCPFCISQWVATGFVVSLVVAPRATRLAASVLAVRAGSDVLQFAYSALEQRAE